MAGNLPLVKTQIHFFVGVTVIQFSLSAWALPTVAVKATSPVAEKGHSFQIHVVVTADQALTNVVVAPIEPEGFALEALGGEGLMLVNNGDQGGTNAVRIAEVPAAGSVTVAFKVHPPNTFGQPWRQKKQSYYSTREPKIFGFNVTGQQVSGSELKPVRVTQSVSLRYTTSIGYYLAAGMVGVLLGYLVKIATQYKDEIGEKAKHAVNARGKLKVFLAEVFVTRAPYLLTLSVLGFGVLLVLAKEALPVSSWHQAIALGIGIGVFSDEQLISKFKV